MVKAAYALSLVAISAIGSAAWHASVLGSSTQGSWTTAQTIVIRDNAAFRAAWSQLYPMAARRPALPAVDFERYRVLIVAAGSKPTGGYRLALSNAAMIKDSAVITLTFFTPPSGCGVTQDITTPAIALAMPVAPLPFRINSQERADTVRCN